MDRSWMRYEAEREANCSSETEGDPSQQDDDDDENDWHATMNTRYVNASWEREEELRSKREGRLAQLVGFDGRPIESVQMPVDQDALSLMRYSHFWPCPRITVHCADEQDLGSLVEMELDKHNAYDFVGVAEEEDEEDRGWLASELVETYGRERVEKWCWVNEDGTKVPLVG